MEQCANCGTMIGDLETPCFWQNQVVCLACHRRISAADFVDLSQPPNTSTTVDRTPQQTQPQYAPYPMPIYFPVVNYRPSRSGITTPLMIAGISDIIVAIIWLFTCYGSIFSIFLIIHACFALTLSSGAKRMSATELSSAANTNAIFCLLVGLFNLVTFICGIVLFCNIGSIE